MPVNLAVSIVVYRHTSESSTAADAVTALHLLTLVPSKCLHKSAQPGSQQACVLHLVFMGTHLETVLDCA